MKPVTSCARTLIDVKKSNKIRNHDHAILLYTNKHMLEFIPIATRESGEL